MNKFTKTEQNFLLKYTRQVLVEFLDHRLQPAPWKTPWPGKFATFVTLIKNGNLRGCVGNLEPTDDLLNSLTKNMIAAASKDSRFAPVRATEIPRIKIGLSILTPLKEVPLDKIEIGDGVYITQGTKNATYLPEVWKEFKTKEEFLTSLCQKAGLPKNSFTNQKIKFFTYQTSQFEE